MKKIKTNGLSFLFLSPFSFQWNYSTKKLWFLHRTFLETNKCFLHFAHMNENCRHGMLSRIYSDQKNQTPKRKISPDSFFFLLVLHRHGFLGWLVFDFDFFFVAEQFWILIHLIIWNSWLLNGRHALLHSMLFHDMMFKKLCIGKSLPTLIATWAPTMDFVMALQVAFQSKWFFTNVAGKRPFFRMNAFVFLEMMRHDKSLGTLFANIGSVADYFSGVFVMASLVASQIMGTSKCHIVTLGALERKGFCMSDHVSFQVIISKKCLITNFASNDLFPGVNKLFVLNKFPPSLRLVWAISARINNSLMRRPLVSFQISRVFVNISTICTIKNHPLMMCLNVVFQWLLEPRCIIAIWASTNNSGMFYFVIVILFVVSCCEITITALKLLFAWCSHGLEFFCSAGWKGVCCLFPHQNEKYIYMMSDVPFCGCSIRVIFIPAVEESLN